MEIRIKKIERLSGWNTLVLKDLSTFVTRNVCLCCDHPFPTLVKIIGSKGGKIEIGCCDYCGYVGYKNIPTQKWIVEFYSKTWNKGTAEIAPKVPTKTSSSTHFVEAIKNLPINKTSAVCEIGSGRGGILQQLAILGFTNIVGTENSETRAKIIRTATQIPIFCGNFEGSSVQEELKKCAPFQLVLSSHVLEHTHNPHEVISKVATLQKHNDYLVLAVPNFEEEPIMGVLLFLPHLHSFTQQALISLLSKNNYDIISTKYSHDQELIVVAQKNNSTKNPGQKPSTGYFESARKKLYKELRVHELPLDKPMRFSWHKKDVKKTQITELPRFFWTHAISLLFKRRSSDLSRSIIMTKISDNKKGPLVLSFSGYPIIFYK